MPDPTTPPPTSSAPADVAGAAAPAPADSATPPAPAATPPANLLDATPPAPVPSPADADAGKGNQPADAPKPTTAPESYAEFKAPEGMQLNPEGIKAFSEFAKTQGLSQEGAQAFIDKLAPAMAAHQQQVIAQTQKAWYEQTVNDPELGGVNLEATVTSAKAAMKQFATPEFTSLLNETGLANHPAVVRVMSDIGKSISEDRFVGGRESTPATKRDAATVLYGTPNT